MEERDGRTATAAPDTHRNGDDATSEFLIPPGSYSPINRELVSLTPKGFDDIMELIKQARSDSG